MVGHDDQEAGMMKEGKPSYESTLADEHGRSASTKDSKSQASEDPFGDESNNEVKYKILKWWQAGMIMIAETISLGILSLPSVLATIGFVGGMLLILLLGLIATYTGYVLGQFKLRYPHVHNMADAGGVLLGPIGREVFGLAQVVFLVFVMGSHILIFSIMLNVLSGHGACTIAFGFVGMIICLIFTLPRRLGDVSWMAIASFISIITAVIIAMAGVGVEKPGNGMIEATSEVTFAKGMLAATNIVFAYAGHVAFFSFISEFKNPDEYPKALYLLQGVDIFMYLLVAAVIYAYAGKDVASPALGSTALVLQKAAYGVAIPTIVIAGVINGHVAAKFIYVRMFRGTGMMGQRSFKSYGAWVAICAVLWLVAWLIAEAIPVFNDLLGLISSLFSSWFTYGLGGVFWLYLNKGRYRENKKKMALTAVNVLIIVLGAAIMVCGMYASVIAIKEDASTSGGKAFSCADNSKNSS